MIQLFLSLSASPHLIVIWQKTNEEGRKFFFIKNLCNQRNLFFLCKQKQNWWFHAIIKKSSFSLSFSLSNKCSWEISFFICELVWLPRHQFFSFALFLETLAINYWTSSLVSFYCCESFNREIKWSCGKFFFLW